MIRKHNIWKDVKEAELTGELREYYDEENLVVFEEKILEELGDFIKDPSYVMISIVTNDVWATAITDVNIFRPWEKWCDTYMLYIGD